MKKPAAIWISLFALLVPLLEGCSGASGPEFGPVTFSPDSKDIVFSYLKGKTSYLFRSAIANGDASRLTKSDCREEYDPVFSPSGEAIAFVCSGHIYLAKKDGSDTHELVPSDGRDQFPRFSPDGQKLYFARYGYYGNYSPIAQPSAHEWNVFVIDLADKKIRSLTSENFYGIDELSISPDGEEMMVTTLDKGILAYSTAVSANSRKVVNPPVHSATENGGKELANAQYARDGGSIFFMAASTGADGFDYDVYKMNLKTEALDRLTTKNGYSTELKVSPDGTFAVLEKWSKNWRSQPVRPALYILNLETRELRKLKIAFKD